MVAGYFVVLSACSLMTIMAQEPLTKMAPGGRDDKSYWKNIMTTLFQPDTTCKSQHFKINNLVSEDQVLYSFGDCTGDLSSDKPLQKICIATLFYLKLACFNSSSDKAIYSTQDVVSFNSTTTCNSLGEVHLPFVENCNSERYCNSANLTLSQMKLNGPICSACSTKDSGESLCKVLFFSLKFLEHNIENVSKMIKNSSVIDDKVSVKETNAPVGQDNQSQKDTEAEKEVPSDNVEDEAKEGEEPLVESPIDAGNDDVALEDADEENSLIGDGIIEEEGKNGPGGKSSKSPEQHSFIDKISNHGHDDEPSYFLSYFLLVSILAIAAYLVFHNKQKILALILEGRRGRQTKGRRRSTSAQYRKLDNNLEEAMGPSSKDSVRHVIY